MPALSTEYVYTQIK